MWMLGVEPEIGTAQVLSDVQLTVAPFAVPVSSFSADEPVLFNRLFQLALDTTPALSLGAKLPLGWSAPKLILTTRAIAVDTEPVKFTPVLLAPLIVTVVLLGLNM